MHKRRVGPLMCRGIRTEAANHSCNPVGLDILKENYESRESIREDSRDS